LWYCNRREKERTQKGGGEEEGERERDRGKLEEERRTGGSIQGKYRGR
jgi:hypothetical protein